MNGVLGKTVHSSDEWRSRQRQAVHPAPVLISVIVVLLGILNLRHGCWTCTLPHALSTSWDVYDAKPDARYGAWLPAWWKGEMNIDGMAGWMCCWEATAAWNRRLALCGPCFPPSPSLLLIAFREMATTAPRPPHHEHPHRPGYNSAHSPHACTHWPSPRPPGTACQSVRTAAAITGTMSCGASRHILCPWYCWQKRWQRTSEIQN